jgi:hypothetical protein
MKFKKQKKTELAKKIAFTVVVFAVGVFTGKKLR